MRWIESYSTGPEDGNDLLQFGGTDVAAITVRSLAGHTWSQSQLTADAPATGPAIGDAIESKYILKRCVGQFDIQMLRLPDNAAIPWVVRTGIICQPSDGDLGVVPLGLAFNSVTGNDLESPWLFVRQFVGYPQIGPNGDLDNDNKFIRLDWDINVGRLIGTMDVLIWYIGCFNYFSGVPTQIDPYTVLTWHGTVRTLIQKIG